MPGSVITPYQVREALSLLYVPGKLADCELASLLPEARAIGDPLARAQALRSRLLDAISSLRSGPLGLLPASASRAYECLRLRYVSGFSVPEVARKLAVSERQAYRDIRFAEELLCSLLQPDAATFLSEEQISPPAQGTDALSEELRALGCKAEVVHLAELVRSAIATVSPLADKQGGCVQLAPIRRDVAVVTTAAVLREILVQVLSCLLQSAPGEAITMALEADARTATIVIPMKDPRELSRRDLLQAALKVAESQSIRCELATTSLGVALYVRLPLARRRKVAIVEDNPGACSLYERYLANSEWEPIVVPHPRLTVDTVAARQAEAVILDIMMAETDGWDVLQALKLSPRTRAVPVVVCSVVNDPELGFALGAAAYLTKPISRRDLLKALRQVALQRMTAAGDASMPE